MQRKSLTDILNGGGNDFNAKWNETAPAAEIRPLPRGVYTCRATRGELETSRHGTPGYRIEFAIIEGEHRGRSLWSTCWLTDAAMKYSKRDLAKLGITTPEQLEQQLPRGLRCKVTVALRRDDSGVERNEVRSFEVIGVDKIEADPFAPADVEGAQ